MAESKLMALLEAECESTLTDVNLAEAGSEEAKDAMYRLLKYHDMLKEERDYALNAKKHADETELKKEELEFKKEVHEDEMAQKAKELNLKQTAQLDDSYAKTQELGLKKEEQQLKITQNQDGKTDRIISYVLTGAGIIVPVVASWIWMSRGLQFEETGSFTSRTGNWISNHMRLFKGKNG